MFFFRVSLFLALRWFDGSVAKSHTVSSVPIRILDAAEKASEPEPILYGGIRNRFRSWDRPRGPYGSYVIYDEAPRKIFHGWDSQGNFHTRKNDPFRPKPSLSYQSVYSNTIKVYEDPVFGPGSQSSGRYGTRGEASENRYGYETPPSKPDYEVHYPYRTDERRYYRDRKIPESFPKVFSPDSGFRFSVFEKPKTVGPPKTFYADAGYYRTYTVNYPSGNDSALYGFDESGTLRKPTSCNFIRLNGQTFPGNDKELCGRTENVPLTLLDYPDYSKFSDREIPVEHRRQNHLKDEIKRRGKRSAGYGYGYGFDAWKGTYSPYGYDRNYNDYYSSYYPSYNDYDNNGQDGNYNYNYRNGGTYRNRGFSYEDRDRGYNYGRENGGRYFGIDRDDEYQNSQETSARGLASFLSEGGRREKSRTRSDNEQDDRDSEDSEEDYKNRRREMFNNKRGNNEEDARNRRGPKRQDGIGGGDNDDEEEDGEQDRNGQSNYSRNFRRNNNGRRYNSRSDYSGNRNRGSYGHNGNYPRNYGDFDRQNRPSGFYGR